MSGSGRGKGKDDGVVRGAVQGGHGRAINRFWARIGASSWPNSVQELRLEGDMAGMALMAIAI